MERVIKLFIGFVIGYSLMCMPFAEFLKILPFDPNNLEYLIWSILKFLGFILLVWMLYLFILEIIKSK
ncbi:hypothetical protein SAMN04487897_1606 [Paenibacillus sp. yr247]|nr:hypothetical protein SAMN04487897_1606 [Paenibacillus sp. yr247]